MLSPTLLASIQLLVLCIGRLSSTYYTIARKQWITDSIIVQMQTQMDSRNMGGVGINIYRFKDQWSSAILHLVVVPNNRLASTIGHVYLNHIRKLGCMALILSNLQFLRLSL